MEVVLKNSTTQEASLCLDVLANNLILAIRKSVAEMDHLLQLVH